MNVWLVSAAVLALGLVPCLWVAARASLFEGLVALELASVLAALCLVLVAQGSPSQPFATLAIVLALASFAGSLFFARYLERQP